MSMLPDDAMRAMEPQEWPHEYAGSQGHKVPPRENPVQEAIRELHDQIDRMNLTGHNLVDRLAPVLRPHEPQNAVPAPDHPDPIAGPLLGSLLEARRRLELLHQTLTDATHRLEI